MPGDGPADDGCAVVPAAEQRLVHVADGGRAGRSRPCAPDRWQSTSGMWVTVSAASHGVRARIRVRARPFRTRRTREQARPARSRRRAGGRRRREDRRKSGEKSGFRRGAVRVPSAADLVLVRVDDPRGSEGGASRATASGAQSVAGEEQGNRRALVGRRGRSRRRSRAGLSSGAPRVRHPPPGPQRRARTHERVAPRAAPPPRRPR